MAKNEMYYGREVTMDEVIERIQAVSRDDVVDLAGEIFLEENLTLVALGRIKEEDLVWPPVS
jgi:predicted Zn-dependent peptidase